MSNLSEVIESLGAICAEADRRSGELADHARRLSRAAASAVEVGASSSRSDARRVAESLHSAQRSVSNSAQLLHLAAVAGRSFAARHSNRGAAAASRAGASAVPTAADVAAWIGDINPGYTGDPFDPRSSNCGKCAAAVFARLDGVDASAIAGLGTLSIAEMGQAIGYPQVPMSPDEIRSALIAAGPGSHAVIGIDRSFGAGHWFNAYYDGSRVVAIDGQSGEVLDWPPEFGSPRNPVTRWDMGGPS